MNVRSMSRRLAAFAVALVIPACGDDGPPTGGGKQDTTPPTVTSVTAIDAYHIQVVFSEALSRSSAEASHHYWIQDPADPDPVIVGGATLADDEKTVSVSTYSPMADIGYDLTVSGVKDVAGNVIDGSTQNFVGSSAADVTPPQVVSRSPGPDALNVPIGVPVVAKFSEGISVGNATWTSDGETVRFDEWSVGDEFRMLPDHTLVPGSHHTVALSAIQDISGNPMPDIQWSFTVTTVEDHTPPRLTSSRPANLAVNVSTQANISLTFSEPLHPLTRFVTIVPYLDIFLLGHLENDGRTLVVETASWLKDNQQYTVWLEPSYFRDLSGNYLAGPTSLTFTTGVVLSPGSIAGRVDGDPGTGAADPSNATIIAEGTNNVAGGTVADNDLYQVTHLLDDGYQVMAIKDSNKDGILDFYYGDAIGIHGVNVELNDFDPDSVEVSGGGQISGINFPIYDPSAVWGRIEYNGVHEDGFEYVALFETEGFDPHNPDDALMVAVSDAYQDDPWFLNSLGQEIPDGDYFVAAYLDIGEYGLDVSVDPYNWYGAPGAPIAVHLVNGDDVGDIVIQLSDPVPGLASVKHSAAWRANKWNATFKHLGDVVRKSQQLTNK